MRAFNYVLLLCFESSDCFNNICELLVVEICIVNCPECLACIISLIVTLHLACDIRTDKCG